MGISISIKNGRAGDGDDVDYPAAPLPPKDVLLCVRTGKVRPLGNSGGKIRSAINKQPRAGPVYVGATGLKGDEVHYELHGGPDKALHQYSASHYAAWNTELPGRENVFQIGGFGENLSTTLLNEENVSHVVCGPADGADGVVERVHPTWPLARVQRYLYHETDNAAAMRQLVERVPELGAEIRDVFRRRLESGTEDFAGRLEGDRLPMDWRSYRLVEKEDLTTRAKRFVFELDDAATETNGNAGSTNGKKDDDEDFAQGFAPHVRLRFGPDQRFSRAYSVVSGNLKRFELGIVPTTTEDIRSTSIYCCGPSSLLAECRQLTQDLGYPRSRTYFEEFGGASSTAGTGDPFESLLDVLNEAGFEIESSCLVGNCGTCMVDYSCNKEGGAEGKGEVVHQGFALSDGQKEDSMLSCVSRAKGRITIDC
ncbi:PK beta-barrel-protein domain-containing protein-like protein [Apiospora saccharicola]|uniref:PK beta-barrel-protein domain-containing protein-like protein n=1 Tax=Apiospora saccharicola TaxID=335842 RepID=A0ABR1USE9_9PEZI